MLFFQDGHGLKLPDLGVAIETVAAFAFHGGDPEGEHGVQTLPSGAHQCRQIGLAGGVHRAGDAAAPGHDVHVAHALQAPGKFLGPVAPEDEVGVGIHKSGQHGLAGGVDDGEGLGVDRGHHVGGFPHGRDDAVFDAYRAVAHDLQIVHGVPATCLEPAVGGKLIGMDNEQISVHGLFLRQGSFVGL